MEKEIWHSTKEATITTISGAPSANCNSLPVIKAISVTTGTVSEMVANTEPKNRFIARWTRLFNTAFNAPKPSGDRINRATEEASKGDRGIHAVEQCLQRAGIHFGDCNNGNQMDNQPDSMPHAAMGRRFTVMRVIVITVIFVLVDKQTLMRFGLDQQKYAIHCRRN